MAGLLTASLASCAPGQAGGQAGDAGKGGASGPPVNLRFMTRGSGGYKAWLGQPADPFHLRNPRVAQLGTDALKSDEDLEV